MNKKPIALLFTLMFFLTACPDNECETGVNALLLDYSGLDGCQWIIELESGQRLEPLNIHEFDLQPHDSLRVRISYEHAPDMFSICMVGIIVRLECIRPL